MGSSPTPIAKCLEPWYTLCMNHKENILRLRAEGKSYNEIQAELGCSKGTIAYHCGEGQKQKSLNRRARSRRNSGHYNKVYRFLEEKVPTTARVGKNDLRALREKVRGFHRFFEEEPEEKFTVDEFKEKFKDATECYLTGRPIDFSDTRTYQLDHVVPRSRGGSNSLKNCEVAVKEANYAKGNQSLEEFILMCYDVVKHWGLIEEIDYEQDT